MEKGIDRYVVSSLGRRGWEKKAKELASDLGFEWIPFDQCNHNTSCRLILLVDPECIERVDTYVNGLLSDSIVLSALSQARLRQMIYSIVCEEEHKYEEVKTLAIMATYNGDSQFPDENTVVLGRYQCNLEEVKKHFSWQPELVILDGHSNGVYFHLVDGEIGHDGELKVPDQKPKVMFLNTCAGLSPSRQGRIPLGLALIESGIDHIIATPYVKGASYFESILAAALIKVGATLGEVVKIVNQMLQLMQVDHPGYLLIGNPELRLTKQADWLSEPTIDEENMWHLKTTCRHVVRMEIVDHQLANEIRNGNVRVYSKTMKGHLYYGFYQDEQKLYLLFYSWRILPEWIHFKFINVDMYYRNADLVLELEKNVRQLELMRLVRPSIRKGPISRYSNLVVNLSRNAILSLYQPHSIESWYDNNQLLEKDIWNALQLVVDQNEKYVTFPLTDRYEERFYCISRKSTGQCPYCHGNLVSFVLANPLPYFERTYISCSICGVIEDVPLHTDAQLSVEKNKGGMIVKVYNRSSTTHCISGYVAKVGESQDGHILWKEVKWIREKFTEIPITINHLDQEHVKYYRILFFVDLVPWYFSIPGKKEESSNERIFETI